MNAVGGISDIIRSPAVANVDFEDVKTVMNEPRKAMMCTASGSCPDPAANAAEAAWHATCVQASTQRRAPSYSEPVCRSLTTLQHRHPAVDERHTRPPAPGTNAPATHQLICAVPVGRVARIQEAVPPFEQPTQSPDSKLPIAAPALRFVFDSRQWRHGASSAGIQRPLLSPRSEPIETPRPWRA